MSCSYARYFFEYDASGRRTKKIDKYGDTTTFEYIGDRLHKAGALQFHYGANDVIGFYYAGKDYFYEKNVQGDIISLVATDICGNRYIAATYEYDAFGNHKVFSANGNENTSPTFIGNINPIRYRGYYFDVETGWYYVDGRYYDPELCRFIDAAPTESINPMVIGGLDCYVYGKNEPNLYKYSSSNSGGNKIAKNNILESNNTSFYNNDEFYATILTIYSALEKIGKILGNLDIALELRGIPDTSLIRSNITSYSYVLFVYGIGKDAFSSAYEIYYSKHLTDEQKSKSFDAELKYIFIKNSAIFGAEAFALSLSFKAAKFALKVGGPIAAAMTFIASYYILDKGLEWLSKLSDVIWNKYKEYNIIYA